MTREEAIKWFKENPFYHKDHEPFNMAIQALSQEPTEKPMTVDEMEREYEKSKALFHKIVECDDAISREDALMCLTGMFKLNKNYNPEELIAIFSKRIKALPSVTQKSETVTEFADRCRECGARYGKLLKQKSGKWVDIPFSHYFKCSECDKYQISATNYCPICGAKMESEDGE